MCSKSSIRDSARLQFLYKNFSYCKIRASTNSKNIFDLRIYCMHCMYSGYDTRECFYSCKLDLIKVFDNKNLISYLFTNCE